jgi:hypothetical protein
MRVVIDFVPHTEQRYGSIGDWQIDSEGNWNIKVSRIQESGLNAFEYQLLVAVHELVEMIDCTHRGITPEAVDAFDMSFRGEDIFAEPGDDESAPYYASHQFACGIERLLAARLGVNWKAYSQAIDGLGDTEEGS